MITHGIILRAVLFEDSRVPSLGPAYLFVVQIIGQTANKDFVW